MEFLIILLIASIGILAFVKILYSFNILSIDDNTYRRYSNKWWFRLFS